MRLGHSLMKLILIPMPIASTRAIEILTMATYEYMNMLTLYVLCYYMLLVILTIDMVITLSAGISTVGISLMNLSVSLAV